MKKYMWLRFFIVLGIPLSIAVFTCCSAQKKGVSSMSPSTPSGIDIGNNGQAFAIAFYNVENLFDTEDDPDKDDAEYLPDSKLQWSNERYTTKQKHLAQVIEAMAFPSVLGVTEIENDKVLQDLVEQPALKKHSYQFVHFESPDERGIDVALLYKSADFKVKSKQIIPIKFPRSTDKTRDILQVTGTLKGEPLTLFVNHFPSRRGGQDDSEPKRIYVAQQLKTAIDATLAQDPKMGIITMGDFNDTPSDISMSQTLAAVPWESTSTSSSPILYNLAANIDTDTEGSIYYKGWSVFDQIIVSSNLMDKMDKSQTIFKKDFMVYRDKQGHELPNRTYTGPIYRGGYSDHFPVIVNMYIK